MSAQPALSLVRNFVPRGRKAVSTTTPEIVKAASHALRQGLDLLVKLDNDSYAKVAGSPFSASIGQHYRHVVEHFQSVTWGYGSGEINYDARARNPRIENEMSYASVVTCDVLRALNRMNRETLNGRCTVVASFGYGSAGPCRLESSVGREVADCTSHAIHHYATIRLICSDLRIIVPEEFGYAPATLKHLSSLAAD